MSGRDGDRDILDRNLMVHTESAHDLQSSTAMTLANWRMCGNVYDNGAGPVDGLP